MSCILRNKKLTEVDFDHNPSACVGHDAWCREDLPAPPREVIKKRYWRATISFIRVRCACVAVASHISPSHPLQHVALLRDSMSPVLAAASALVVFARCRVPAHAVQGRALLGTMLLQRWRARASLQDKVYLGNERLQLLCCGCPLSALLLRLANVVDHSGCASIEHMHVVCIMKRYFGGVARGLWSKCMQTGSGHDDNYDDEHCDDDDDDDDGDGDDDDGDE